MVDSKSTHFDVITGENCMVMKQVCKCNHDKSARLQFVILRHFLLPDHYNDYVIMRLLCREATDEILYQIVEVASPLPDREDRRVRGRRIPRQYVTVILAGTKMDLCHSAIYMKAEQESAASSPLHFKTARMTPWLCRRVDLLSTLNPEIGWWN